jgi:bifunctional non-homologous end joining protein LigD
MALEEYKRKRDFRRTPEPAGEPPKAPERAPIRAVAAPLSFVIQKHAATRLHYDFRLELGGVLKSWAVPKGPSLDPHEKRLAVHVEDHPIEYGGFEGVIPKGEYGGGTVMLWDRGTWTPEEPDPEEGYRKGSLKFTLNGAKLHGRWALVRMAAKTTGNRNSRYRDTGRENWLLIKERDDLALPDSGSAIVDDNPLSVATGRAMETIAADRDRVWHSDGGGETATDAAPTKPPPARRRPVAQVAGARKAPMPDSVAPQLATLTQTAPDGAAWLHEIKYDGYRLLVRIERDKARLTTRKGLDWTDKFPGLTGAFAQLAVETALIDGEVVAIKPDGTTDFGDLQDAIATGKTAGLVFFAFDLLYRDGTDLTDAALEDRKAALAELIPPDCAGTLRYSDHQEGRGPEFFQQVCNHPRLEGIISKRRDRPYRPGRGGDWLKLKCENRDEFIIVGFTEPAGRRHGFGALQMGYYDPRGELRYAGRVGTGFDDEQLTQMRARLDAIERHEPTVALPQGVSRKGVRWTEPSFVAEVRYAGWTGDAMIRQGSFQGLREDKPPEEVIYDPNAVGDPPPADPEPAAMKQEPPAVAAGSTSPTPARDGSIMFEGVRLTNPDRVLYPDPVITKLALARYYTAIADWALPHLAHRPLSLVRCPEGVGKDCFYQKHVMAGVPDIVRRIEIAEKSGTETYLVVENAAGLVALVQLGILEIHPWGCTVPNVEKPDLITFDFDPDEGLAWERVTGAAMEMREALAGIGLQSFAKTTGGKGLHVVAPVTPKLDWDAIKEFAKWVSERFAKAYPDRFTTNMAKRARAGRIFIDYLRNGRGSTAIGTYSTRARAGAPVATPLSWEEVEAGVRADGFSVLTVPDRLARLKADPWDGFADVKQSISASVRREIGI